MQDIEEKNLMQIYKTISVCQTILKKYHRDATRAFIIEAKENWMQKNNSWKCMIYAFKNIW